MVGKDLVFLFLLLSTQFLFFPWDAPLGFEYPKVYFTYFLSLIGVLILLTSPREYYQKLKLLPRKLLILIIVSALLACLSTILSADHHVALWGNEFRQTGLFFFLNIHLLFLIFILLASRNNLRKYAWLVLLTSFGQLLISYIGFLGIDSLRYGSFGQINFVSYQLLVLIVSALFLCRPKVLAMLQIATFVLLILLGSRLAQGLFIAITLVYWGSISLMLLLRRYRPGLEKLWTQRSSLSQTAVIVAVIIGLLVVITLLVNNIDESRYLYSTVVIELIAADYLTFTFGHGLDTLQIYSMEGLGTGQILDRSHNLLLDIIFFLGFIYLCFFSMLILRTFVALIKAKEYYLFLILLLFLISALAHTRSAYHFLEFVIFLAFAAISLDTDS